MIPKYLKEIQSTVDSVPYGSVDISTTKVSRKVTRVTTTTKETLRYTNTDAAIEDIIRILKGLSMSGHSGKATIECDYNEGQIVLVAIYDKKETNYS